MKRHEVPLVCWCAAICCGTPADVCCCFYKQHTAHSQHNHTHQRTATDNPTATPTELAGLYRKKP